MQEIAVYEPKYWTLDKWQFVNSHILALCPDRWKDMHFKQKWVLLRILADRKDYVPDWIDPELWRKLAPKLRVSYFDADTEMLIDCRREPGGRSRYSADDGTERGLEQAYLQQYMGEAPQHIRDNPVNKKGYVIRTSNSGVIQ